MVDTNYISTIVRILELPKVIIVKNNFAVTEFRAQIPQLRNATVVNLVLWGNLARDVASYYKPNDYILVEGYISLPKVKMTKNKKVEIVVLKVYPFLLNYDRSLRKE